MRLSEEVILLLLNEESGYMEHVGGWNMACAMAGSVLADLALDFRIDTDLNSLTLLDSTPTGDELLDPVLAQIAAAPPENQNAQYWIEKTADRTEWVIETVLDRLVRNNILDHDSGGFWSLNRKVSRTGMYPPTGGVTRQETKSRIFSAILDEEIPDPRDVLLISMVNACDAFRLLLAEEEFEHARDRIDLICKMDLADRLDDSTQVLACVFQFTILAAEKGAADDAELFGGVALFDFAHGDEALGGHFRIGGSLGAVGHDQIVHFPAEGGPERCGAAGAEVGIIGMGGDHEADFVVGVGRHRHVAGLSGQFRKLGLTTTAYRCTLNGTATNVRSAHLLGALLYSSYVVNGMRNIIA